MLTLVLCLTVSAAKLNLAAPGLKTVNVDDAVAQFLNDALADRLNEQGIKVVTGSQMASVIGLARQKELLGCTETNSECLAELSGALGVDGLVLGSVARLETAYAVNLRVISSGDGRQLATAATKAPSQEAVLDWLAQAAKDLARQLAPKDQPGAPASVRSLTWLPAGAGVLLGAGSAVLFGFAQGVKTQLDAGDPSVTSGPLLDRRIEEGKLYQGLSAGLLVSAGVALTVAVLFYVLGEPVAPLEKSLSTAWRFP